MLSRSIRAPRSAIHCSSTVHPSSYDDSLPVEPCCRIRQIEHRTNDDPVRSCLHVNASTNSKAHVRPIFETTPFVQLKIGLDFASIVAIEAKRTEGSARVGPTRHWFP